MLPAFLKRATAPGERVGLVLVAAAVVFSAWCAAPELRVNRVPLNDLVLHITASERMESSFERGEPFLDPWVSEWALGYPMWRSYQPLPHVAGAFALRLFRGFGDPAAVFAALFYLLLVTFPISVYVGARLLGLSPPAAGLASVLAFAPSAGGEPGRYGLAYGALVWRGSGLFTQLFALTVMVIAMGWIARALDSGARWKRALASALMALTALSHIVFGYAVFVSAAVLAVVGPRARRARRVMVLATIALAALLLLAWFVVPLARAGGIVNHSHWENPVKWDSFGAVFILGELVSGRLLDFGRLPLLTILLAIGAAGAIVSRREACARRLLALCGVWLALFFGRETWGRLVALAGIPGDMPLHRFQAMFELSAILLGAYGVVQLIQWAGRRKRAFAVAGIVVVAAAVIPIGVDRAHFMAENRVWGEANLASYRQERPELEAALADVRAILAQRPGRASAGLAASSGGQFKIGSVPVYAFLSRAHIDQPDFLYHAMSKTADIMVVRDEANAGHDVVFGIRAVVAPAGRRMPSHLRLRSVHGRFAVYESSFEGYFGIVDIAGHYVGPSATNYEPSAAWLKSPLQPWGLVISLDPRAPIGPAIQRWDALPPPSPALTTLRGRVVSEDKNGEDLHASIEVNRAAYAFVKITWSPDLAAAVDGRPAPMFHVTPGFSAVPIPAGRHDVSVAYRPGRLKPLLFVFGIAAFALAWPLHRRWKVAELEERVAERVAAVARRVAQPAVPAVVLILAGVVALHPLFRGKLIAGHDAACYPPRVVEMAQAIRDGHFPPIWAPDLSAGHGQPLFEFSPPLVYWVALPFRVVGCGLTDSLQLGLALLTLLGAAAVYGIGRRLEAPRHAALGGAIAWVFGPYLCLDLFVRAAFAEAAAVAVAPIALLALLAAISRPDARRIATAAAAVALIGLAHSAVALLLIPAFSLVVLACGGAAWRLAGASEHRSRASRLAPLVAGAAGIAGAIGLTAYFWIPSLAEIGNLHRSRLFAGTFNWSEHIISPVQLLWSRWGYGYSVPGPNDGISFDLGLPHLVLGVAGLIVAWRLGGRTRRAVAWAFAGLTLAGALLTCEWTSWLWSRVTLLQYVQLPWRALLIPGLFLPLLAVFAFERVGPRWTAALVAVLIAVNLPHTEPQGYQTYDDEYYDPGSIAAKGINTTTHEEFEPRWMEQRPAYEPRPLVGLSGPIEATVVSRRTARQELLVTVAAPTRVESAIAFYPGWQLSIDGKPAAVEPTPVRGTMQFDLPAGRHTVVLELRRTPVRSRALLLSLVTALLLAAGAATRLGRHSIKGFGDTTTL